MRAALTGASGHLGANVLRALVAAGHDVRAIVREDARALEGLPVERVEADLFDPDSLRHAFRGRETVFHLAGRISIAGDRDGLVRRTNVLGTRNVAAASLAEGVRRLVHVSSIHAFADPGEGRVLDESAPSATGPSHPAYDRSKAEGEREVLEAASRGLEVAILEPAATIGPHDFKPSRMGRVLCDLAARRVPALVGGGFAWVDSRDVASAAVAAASAGRPGGRYLLAGAWRSVGDVAGIVAKETGVPSPRFTCPLALARLAAPFAEGWARLTGKEPLFTRESLRALRGHRNVSCARAREDLGFRPRPLEETIADTLSWFRERGAIR